VIREGDIRVARLGVNTSGRITQEAMVSRWLVGVAGVVLVIACLNVTNLLLARVTRRRRDMAVRMALGSGSWRVTRAVLAESTLLALAGCGAGLLVANGGGVLVRTTLLPQIDWSAPVVSPRVLGLSAAVALIVAVAVGLGPAWQTLRSNVVTSLKTGDREAGAAAHSCGVP
jgi:ABC-type antimicrobial peptide transport system permease subunit